MGHRAHGALTQSFERSVRRYVSLFRELSFFDVFKFNKLQKRREMVCEGNNALEVVLTSASELCALCDPKFVFLEFFEDNRKQLLIVT